MKEVTRWAIRHKPTGNYLPIAWYRKRRQWFYRFGYTWREPDAGINNQYERTEPRLFWEKVEAERALKSWLSGQRKRGSNPAKLNSNTILYTADSYTTHLIPTPHRKADEMEIVPVTITFP